ncbi:MAG TPA: PEP-CTERM sorting domain-containing protein [Gammaproteobacteria bacterium]|nr:PEP-CTERM sorting domain-containing protein [Gammaproteobacteria bacterium]
MRHLKTAAILTGAVGGALLMAGQALADPVTVDGIQWQSGATFQSAQIYENFVNKSGDELSGFGRIDAINGTTDYCANGGVGSCELTFSFSGYVAQDFGMDEVTFTGGMVQFYADTSPNFDPSNGATATDGQLFLDTVGHTFQGSNGNVGTLLASAETGDFTTDQFQGHGAGMLDVTGGDAMAFFDSNQFNDHIAGGPGADLQFISDFSPNSCTNSGTSQPICGSGTIKGLVKSGTTPPPVSVPEPGALGLMGLGLLGIGFATRRRYRRR